MNARGGGEETMGLSWGLASGVLELGMQLEAVWKRCFSLYISSFKRRSVLKFYVEDLTANL